MNSASWRETVALGIATGMRSFSGPTVMAMRHGGLVARVAPVLAAAEMVADKTSVIGNRTDPAPLAGRAAMGALVGALIARRHRQDAAIGAFAGAAIAVIAAHAAFYARARLPLNGVTAGLAEDALVMGICGCADATRGRA